MKKLFSFILLVLIFVQCGEKDQKLVPIELNTNKLTFTEVEGSEFISVSTVTKWTVSAGDASWVECMPNSGEGNGRVQVKVKKNDLGNARTATLIFQATGGATASLEILQEVAAPYILVQPATIEVLTAGEDLSISVNANYNWSVAIPVDAQSWVSLKSKTESIVVFTVKPNTSDKNRTASISFQLDGKDVKTSLALSQKNAANANVISLTPQSANVLADGESVTVSVSAGVEWNINIPAKDTWITVKEKSNNQAIMTVAENITGIIRSSNVVFTSTDGGATAIFSINQDKGYALASFITFPDNLLGKSFSDIHTYSRDYGFDYSENPHCSGGYGGHPDGTHLVVEKDAFLNKNVFRFDIHITPVIDGDRCNAVTVDRQRNEYKTQSNNTSWAKIQGNYDEWQVLEFKFKLPIGFQPTSNFGHIHQIKAVDGTNNGSPIITLSPRSNSSGGDKRMQIIHSVDGGGTALGTFVDNIPLSDFEGEWVQVREEIHYTHSGFYACKITRIRDNKVLINVEKNNIDMWRKGSSYIRSKYGIYRSLAGGDLSKSPVGQSPLLKNESIWMCDFTIYEKNPNPNPGKAVE